MKILNWFRMKYKLWLAKLTKDNLNSFKVKNILKEKIDRVFWKDIIVTDNFYTTTDYKTLKELASLVPVRFWRKYEREVSDCDDFAWAYRYWFKLFCPRFPIGYCHVRMPDETLHALNFFIFVTDSGRFDFVFIEPQTGKIFYTNYTILWAIV